MARTGRPPKYGATFPHQAKKLCELGATDEDLADFFNVSIRTIANWQRQHPEFLQSLKAGKEASDERVERSLYQRAVGYTFDSEKVQVLRDGKVVRVPTREHVAPDVTAQIFWLKNRRPEAWRDKQVVEHEGEITHYTISDDPLTPDEWAEQHAKPN